MEKEMFVLVEASKLSMNDDFIKHATKSDKQKSIKDMLVSVIQNGVKDFWCPKVDPSLDEDGNICFEFGQQPETEKSYTWWSDNAKTVNPERKSRLGTKSEYIAFIGVLIKALVADGWSVDDAWYAVCDDSRKLGHYNNPENPKRYCEATGTREVCGFCDLANTAKIVADNKYNDRYWIASSYFLTDFPIAALTYCPSSTYWVCGLVGWIVMD